jgi:hypothetical protein
VAKNDVILTIIALSYFSTCVPFYIKDVKAEKPLIQKLFLLIISFSNSAREPTGALLYNFTVQTFFPQ